MDSQPRTILFATDATSASTGARAAAVHLCRSGHAELHLVHATSPWAPVEDDPAMAWSMMARERQHIEEDMGCAVAGTHLPHGLSVPAILRTARTTSADLIVVGGRRLGFAHRLLTYRVSRGVVEAAHVPVLVVPGDESTWPPQHVVTGCDGSEESRRAADLAAWIAAAADADLLVTSVAGAGLLATAAVASQVAEACADQVRSRGAVRRVSTRVVESAQADDALHEICAATAGRVLLAVGARGSGALRRPDHASVSAALTDSMHVPMLMVPPGVLAALRGARRVPVH